MDSSDDVYFARFGRKLAMIAGSILFTAGAAVVAGGRFLFRFRRFHVVVRRARAALSKNKQTNKTCLKTV